MAVLSQDRIVNELIPFIKEIMSNEEDEVLLAISEEISHFKNYLDDKYISHIFPLFQFLFGSDESVVRESAIKQMRELVDILDESQVQKYLVPLIMSISNMEGFQWKVSAIYLIRMCYTKVGKDKDKLKALYFKLCEDDTPIIKRTAAKEFGPFCLIVEKNVVASDMIQYYKMFMNESDIIRATILPSLVQLVSLSKNNQELQRVCLQFIVAASEDMSWRVRNQLCLLFPEIANFLGSKINELVPTLAILINDSETQVKTSALKSFNNIIKKISPERIISSIVPSLRNVGNETSKEVKAIIGESLGPIANKIGYNQFNSNLGTVMDVLLKDDNPEVKLGIAKSMYQIIESSNGNLISSVNALLGTMQKDSKYRVRECVYTTLAQLGTTYGIDTFRNHIEPLYINYLSDSVASVRHAGAEGLRLLIQAFGNNWILSYLVPKIQTIIFQNKCSYLTKLCGLESLEICGEYLDAKQMNDSIIPIFIKCLKDKIPNVRFYTIKVCQKIYNNFDAIGKEKICSIIKTLYTDEDTDVRYYASKFMENIK